MFKTIGLTVIGTIALAQDGAVSAQRIREYTKYLSSDQMEGRGVGTRGDRLATEYIANQFAAAGAKPDAHGDFRRVLDRKDIDAVVVATPDHWHGIPTILACQAGKDVY